MNPELLVLLQEELQKPEYNNKSLTEVLDMLHSISEQAVGKIRGDDKLHLVDILARGLRKRIRDCQHEALKDAFTEALEPSYLAAPAYSINVSLPEIRGMLEGGLLAGVVLQGEYDKIISLAAYTKKKFESVVLKDVIAIVEPELLDNQWHELPETIARNFVIRLLTAPPESTHIVIQMQDQYDDGSVSDWYHSTALHGVSVAREYVAALPFNGYPRKLRWKCDYTLDAVVSVR